jgi:tryptophan synthase beta chain
VYMVRVSYRQKPYRRILMETWGAEVVPSPSDRTRAGRAILEQAPTRPAAWGLPSARPWRTRRPTRTPKYSLGSVLNHVLLHQTVIGL